MIRLIFTITLVFFILQFIVLGSIETSTMKSASAQPAQPAQPAQSSNDPGSYKTVNYYARFNCGTIGDDKGPLRPGKYDSDITIFNKKSYPITVIWKPIAIDQQVKNNFNILNIPSENIASINCAKIFPNQEDKNNATTNSISAFSKRFTEGIIKLEISIDNGLLVNNFLNNQNANIIVNESDIGNLINVDVLHTVNTLDDLNKEVVYLKTDFSILSKDKNKMNNFTAVFHIDPDEIIDPLSMIKKKISDNNTNQKIDINGSEILLKDTDIISNTLTDNHALTVQRVDPIIS